MEGSNCDEVSGCVQGTIYYDNSIQAMRRDLFVGDGSGTSIHNENFTIISNFTSGIKWYCNVIDNSYIPVVADRSKERSFIQIMKMVMIV